MILVDDGSRVDCRHWFDELGQLPGVTVLHHEVNHGKGRALKTAFSYYLEHFDLTADVGVVTADADGQHLPEDIYATAQQLAEQPDALVLGTRNFNQEDVPFKSRNGNKITTAVFQLLYGKRINDTQTGLRAIPNGFLPACLELKGERFEYEILMLISAVRRKVNIREQTIQTVYFEGNRETHFHPVKDSLKIYRVLFSSFFKFACSGLACVVLDQGLFALFQKVIFRALGANQAILLATVFSRLISSLVNYGVNRTVVFEQKKSGRGSLLRYYALCVCQMAASAGGVIALHALTQADPSILKLVVDTVLFFVSYQIQQRWVFRESSK